MMARFLMIGLRNFMDGYMGSYVRCLMDYGELPVMGSQNNDLKKSTSGNYVCNKLFSFSVQTGYQPNSSGASVATSTGGASSSVSSSKSKSTDSSKPSSSKNSGSSSSDGTSSGSSLSDVASRERNRRSRGSSEGGSAAADSGSSSLKSSRLRSSDGEDESSISSSRVVGDVAGKGGAADLDGDSARSGRARYRALSGEMQEKIEKNSKKAQTLSKLKSGVPTVLAEEEGGRLGPRKSTVTPWERKPTAVEDEVESAFSFGKFFKFIIIIALIIMIVIFFGGQLLNYSKSDE